MTFEEYKTEVKNIVINRNDNIDLSKVEMMIKVMMYKIRRHYLNGRTVNQCIGYINIKF